VGAQVFISYSSKDSKPARAICSALESRGLSCWISSRDVGPGESFMDAIVNAIGVAKVMVLVFSENANNSEDIKREIVLASTGKVTIIPVRVEDVVPKGAFAYQFATRQWIDLFEDWEAQIERLAKWIAGATSATANAQASAEPKDSIPDSPAINSDGALQEEALRRAGEEAQRKKDDAEAQRIAEDNRRQQAEAQRIAAEQERQQAEAQRIAAVRGQQQAEAERLAQEEKDRVRAAEAARLAEAETQKEKAASEAAAPSDKAGLRRILTIGALGMIAVFGIAVLIAVQSVERPPAGSTMASLNCARESDSSAAVATCTQAIALNPKDEWSYSNRCVANVRLGNYSAALADCNQTIAFNDPGNWTAYYFRGAIYEKLGMKAAAIADYQKTITMKPSSPYTQYTQDALKRLGASPAAPGGR
jgi:tetratricopeptide (TPR) repeat protein